MSKNINKIIVNNKTLIDLTNNTVTADKIPMGITTHDVTGSLITGAIPIKSSETFIHSTSDQIISANQFINDDQIIQGEPNLLARNIKSGITLFNIEGNMQTKENELSDNLINFLQNGILSEDLLDLELTAIQPSAFRWNSIKNPISIYLQNCETIGDEAFYGGQITQISCPKCTKIYPRAFAYCSNLSMIDFPECTDIYYSAFYNCSNLTSVSFPKCSYIGNYAFQSCSNLSTFSFPECSTIGSYAFGYCYNLLSLYLMGSSICTLTSSAAFYSTPIAGYTASTGAYGSIYVPASLYSSYSTATNWVYFSSRFVSIIQQNKKNNINKIVCKGKTLIDLSEDNIVTEKMLKDTIAINSAGETIIGTAYQLYSQIYYPSIFNQILSSNLFLLGEQTIKGDINLKPENIKADRVIGGITGTYGGRCLDLIDFLKNSGGVYNSSEITQLTTGAFAYHSNISISFPNCINIGEGAFLYSPIEFLSFPKCTTIGSYAFHHATIPSVCIFPQCTQIKNSAFAEVHPYGIKNLILPKCISIGTTAFYDAGTIKLFLLGSSVCSVANDAFQNCYSTGRYADARNNFSIYVPASLYSTYMYSTGLSGVNGMIFSTPTMPQFNTNILLASAKTFSVIIPPLYNDDPIIELHSSDENIIAISDISLSYTSTQYYSGQCSQIYTFTLNALGAENESAEVSLKISLNEDQSVVLGESAGICKISSNTTSYEVVPVSGASYGFAENSNGYYESQNKGINNSYAICQVNINAPIGTIVHFDCINYTSGESNYDFGLIGQPNQTLSLSYTADSNVLKNFKGLGASTSVQTVSLTGASESYFVQIKFRKDSVYGQGNDSLQFKVRFS